MVPETDEQPEKKGRKKYYIIGAVGFLIVLFLLSLIVFFWARSFNNRLPPNVYIGSLAVSGLNLESARQILQEKIDEILTTGINIKVDDDIKTLTLATLVSSDLVEDAGFDLDSALRDLMASHNSNLFLNTFAMIKNNARGTRAQIPLKLNHEKIQGQVLELFPDKETLSRNAGFEIVSTPDGWSAIVTPAQNGREFQWDPFFEALESQLSILNPSELTLRLKNVTPAIDEQNAIRQVDGAIDALNRAPYEVAFVEENRAWEMTPENLATILTPGKKGAIEFLEEPFLNWVSQIITAVDRPAQDARLEIAGNRVVDFAGSRDGRAVEVGLLSKELLAHARGESDSTIQLTIRIEKPRVETGDVNDLGITQPLGVGTSNYRGSPINRRANIQNGVNLLNGLLIAPGDTFSLLAALAPFTTENGYLPELVIKGDKIIPEIGGGLCQIGTTTFRATMNSGLPILERRNHSIVVSYYNDPANGSPGTDATIYEPAPDFKFKNDTGNYILFQAENLTEIQELRFTFWGTSDGRTGSYSAPTVLLWIPVGEDVRVETTDLEPEKETCQSSHIGADTTFVYTITRPDGTLEQTEFTSHYRPLPKICLVGVEKIEEKKEEAVAPGFSP